jgi:hypothetical protein
MSKIEVNTVAPQCGTTLTLGESGDTVQLGTGASQSGFGRTGTVDWQTSSIKTATFTAVNGQGFFCDTNGGAFTCNLPAGAAGAIVSLQDYRNTFDTANLTVQPNGSEKINGGAGPVILSTEGEGITLVYIDSTVGWRSIQDNDFATVGSNFISATGGTISCSGNCRIHTFTGPGTFTVSALAATPANNQVSYAVIAGGGAGGSNRGGGGGAGGFREDKSPVTPYTASPLEGAGTINVTATSFPITVGAGGAAAPNPCNSAAGGTGGSSTFSTITSAGGGGGGARCRVAGTNGGSGGGAGSSGPGGGPSAGGTGNSPSVSPAQGTNGGQGGRGSPLSGGMGGGGATIQGSPQNVAVPGIPTPLGQSRGVNIGGSEGGVGGDGGQGATTEISGSPVGYAGGGGGGGSSNPGTWSPNTFTGGTGGMFGNPATGATPLFGGANGGDAESGAAGSAAVDNKGGGGGGGGGGGNAGGNGGSGVVIIRYKIA